MPIATLVDGTDLNAWSARREAQSLLPRVIRRLVHATSERVERIGFPADEGVQLGGYDGVVRVAEGNAFVPEGTSVWELGTNRGVKAKADEDYKKRCDDPLSRDPSETSFVFVTPRRWGGKDNWVASKEAEGFWREVRAYDADDLEEWLELAPGVHVWLSSRLGKQPEGARDLAGFWAAWSGVTNPPMSPDLVVLGRDAEADRLLEWMRGEPSALTCRAESREEALAFFAAALHRIAVEERAPFLSRAIVAEDVGAWRQLRTAENALLLVPMFDARDDAAAAVGDGHHVLVPLGKAEGRSSATVEIPRPRRHHAKDALAGIGLPHARAERLAGLARHSPMALRRELAVLPEVHRPEWAKPAEAGPLLPAMLVGTWDDANDADREVVAKLAGSSYGEVERALVRWANESDPPVRRIGDNWLISSKEDSWTLLADLLGRGDLDNFEGAVLEVLGEIDPAYDLPEDRRWMAGALVGPLPHSSVMREGLADTLALMSARDDVRNDASASAASNRERAARIVRRLLAKANEDWRLWASLSGLLPLLAEAAPDEFLEAVEVGVSGEHPVLANLFSAEEAFPFGTSPHTALLWALEGLAWNPDYLARASRSLAKLARIDLGGRTLNRPQNSLREIFLCWNPQTATSLDRRLAVLDGIRGREPQVAWRLMCATLPELHSISHPTHKPRYREWSEDLNPSPLTWGDVSTAVEKTVDRLLEDVGVDGQRWQDLIDKVDDVPKLQRDAIVDALLDVEVDHFDQANRTMVRDALRAVISKHREFPNADWAMPGQDVDRLQEAYERFEPDNPVSKHAWLFSNRPDLLDPPRGGDWRAEQEAIETARFGAAREVYAQGGLDSLLDLAARCENPFVLGRTLGEDELPDEEDELLRRGLDSSDDPLKNLTRGFVIGRQQSRGWSWIEAKLTESAPKWSPEQRAEFFVNLHFEGRTWDRLEAIDDEARRLYWTRIGPYGLADASECQRAVRKFLEYDRPHVAVEMLALHLDNEEAGVRPPVVAEALERAIKTSIPEDLHPSSFAYHVGELIDVLEESGEIEETRMAGLEWGLLPLLEHSGKPPRTLHLELSRNAKFFAEVVELVYKPEDEEPSELSEEDLARARLGSELLENWREIPGRNEDGSVDPQALRAWVSEARQETSARGRGKIGDHLIGKALYFSPRGPDGAWPDVAVRDLLEDLENEGVERGIELAVYNNRGVVSRGLDEGGEQERRLVNTHGGDADTLSDRWPRASALLRRIAHGVTNRRRGGRT
ncbi:MAG: hypothetical protein M3R38_09925 [Actinomycetota bacterium]|nr:hypothetical protein [Actinomycetota bacterium]